jgi:hypothetical protein
MVGQGGQIYARVEENTGKLTVKWGKQVGQSCEIKYRLPKADNQPVTQINQPCGGDNSNDQHDEKPEEKVFCFPASSGYFLGLEPDELCCRFLHKSDVNKSTIHCSAECGLYCRIVDRCL